MFLNKLKPQNGSIIISEPFLEDDYFKRSVVLLIEHNKNGTFGFMLNRPVDLKINDAISDFPEYDGPLYFGGPVANDQLFYIHTLGDAIADSTKIMEGLYWGGSFENVRTLIEEGKLNNQNIRFFSGYSGWEASQLQDEIKIKSWVVTEGTVADIMFGDSSDLWKEVLKKMGAEYALYANSPEDPSLN